MSRVLLINGNIMQPPVAPIAFDYLGSALQAAGIEVCVVDPVFFEPTRIEAELIRLTNLMTPDVIGITVRNIDDCCMATRDFQLPRIARWIAHLKRHSEAKIVVGGVGFSVMPREAFDFLDPHYGIAGDGEQAVPRLVEGLASGRDTSNLPGLLWRGPRGVEFNSPVPADLTQWPLPTRRTVDNARYIREGGMVGIETKRGCSEGCIYCADPVAKGTRTRQRPPKTVVEEIRDLLDQHADVYHTCDSEFNVPLDHSRAVCKAIIEAGLGDQIRWYAYCSPVPFDRATAQLYRRAGCQGINFGCDSGNDVILARLGRSHQRSDIAAAVAATKAAGMSCMIDLLLGAPGETVETISETIEMAKTVGADRVGLSVGIRVYAGTPFARECLSGSSPRSQDLRFSETELDLLRPYFWVEPSLGDSTPDIVREKVGKDPRFFFMDPTCTEANYNYNYNNNSTLVTAIRKGYRGAFWDILRRVAENLPPP